MALRYTIEEVTRNGAVDRRSETYSADSITLGRGSGSTVRLPGTLVGLNHLRLTVQGASLVAEDLGSLAGTKINDKLVTRQELKSGDTIKLADVTLTALHTKEGWEVIEKRHLAEKVDVEERVKQDVARVALANHLPSMRWLSLLAITISLAICFLIPFSSKNKDGWSSGPISNKHVAFANNCESCHKAPFSPVTGEDCQNCHKLSDHSALVPAGHKVEGDCMSCHMEHQGDAGLTVQKSSSCTDCHGDIKSKFPKAISPLVTSFAKHPEFSVTIAPVEPGKGDVLRVALSDKKNLADHSNVKLNHEVHLKGPLRTPTGTKTLVCASCHVQDANGKEMRPIEFKRDCQECHSLGFDPRLPDRQVPHGNSADEIYKFLYAEYAQFFLNSKNDPQAQKAFSGRMRPGDAAANAPAAAQDDFTKAFVEGESRNAEHELFAKTACQLCHEVRERTDVPADDLRKQGKSVFALLPPQVPSHWMTKALFSHSAHDAVRCESCHAGVASSKNTQDVLLPGVKSCQSCHADASSSHLVKSDCTMCHSFHDKVPLETSKQQRVDQLISAPGGDT